MKGYDYQTSGLSFTSLYMWRNINNFSWKRSGDYLLLAGASHLEKEGAAEPFFLPPLTKDGRYEPDGVRKAVLDAKECFEAEGHVFQMRLVPGHMLGVLEEAFPDQMYFSEDRPNYDYVYRRSDLAELKGRDYHSKKNHLNYFRKNYSYEYVPLTSGMAWEAIEFVRELNRSRDRSGHELELLKMEEGAMADVFCHMEEAGYMGGAIRIDGKMQALTVGGQLNLDTAVVHIEKANTNFRGLYQAINNEFCRNMPDSTEFVNREEDMGIPNLRKAKLSYKPVKMIEKYIAAFK